MNAKQEANYRCFNSEIVGGVIKLREDMSTYSLYMNEKCLAYGLTTEQANLAHQIAELVHQRK